VKSDDPIGWRRKLTPMPRTGSNSLRRASSRASGVSRKSTFAEESVMDAPKPSIRW
jgi:hypothetical protein